MQDLQPRRRESCNCWFLTQPTCNSWVLSSLGKESTKTCHPVEVLCKCQYSFSPLCPWQSWQPFVQITGCDLHLQVEAWKPRKGWQAGPCPGNPECSPFSLSLEILAPGGYQCCCRSCLPASLPHPATGSICLPCQESATFHTFLLPNIMSCDTSYFSRKLVF